MHEESQLGFYFDQTRCTGCYACVVACKDAHDIPAGPANWISVLSIERGKYPQPFLAYLWSTCYHCDNPSCVPACPEEAISKREQDGIVVADRQECTGCGLCSEACPYGAPQFGAEENATMQKCDLCLERWADGKRPVCVTSCPTRALDAGPMNEMRAMHGEIREAAGFIYNDELRPSVVIKPKR